MVVNAQSTLLERYWWERRPGDALVVVNLNGHYLF